MPSPSPDLPGLAAAIAAGPAAAADLLHDPRRLRAELIDPQRRAAGPAASDAAAAMVLDAEDRDAMLTGGLRYLCRRLGAGRSDAGLGSPASATFASTAQAEPDGHPVVDVVGIPIPNRHWVVQRTWRSPAPTAFDLERDPRCAALRCSPALQESRVILTHRLAFGPAVGMVCVDQLGTRREWTETDVTEMGDWISRFMAPLAALHAVGPAGRADGSPTPAELAAIRLVAQGLTYREVAAELGKSVRTISNQLTSARRRTGARSEADLVRRCWRWLDL